MKRTLCALVAGLLSVSAFAQVYQPAPDVNPRGPAIERQAVQGHAPASLRELSLKDARALLSSTEGPAWHIYSVHAPACTKQMKKKECKAIRKQCSEAKKFSSKNKVHATCSALYTQASALMTTAPGGTKAK